MIVAVPVKEVWLDIKSFRREKFTPRPVSSVKKPIPERPGYGTGSTMPQ